LGSKQLNIITHQLSLPALVFFSPALYLCLCPAYSTLLFPSVFRTKSATVALEADCTANAI